LAQDINKNAGNTQIITYSMSKQGRKKINTCFLGRYNALSYNINVISKFFGALFGG
jgi:hypothetical protein